MIEIKYDRGEIRLNEFEFFPAGVRKMKHLLRIISGNYQEFEIAQQISDYLCAQIETYKRASPMAQKNLEDAQRMLNAASRKRFEKRKDQIEHLRPYRQRVKDAEKAYKDLVFKGSAYLKNLVTLRKMYGEMLKYKVEGIKWERLMP